MREFMKSQGLILGQILVLTVLFTTMMTQESAQLTTVILILTLALIGMSVGFILGQLIVVREENETSAFEANDSAPEVFIEDIASNEQLDELFLQHLRSDGLFIEKDEKDQIPPIRPAV